MPFFLSDGAAWVIREALATHPVARALVILDGLQPVMVTPAASPTVEPLGEAGPPPTAEVAATPATPSRRRHA